MVRRIPIPVHKKPEQSYTHRVQIGMPVTMTTTSVSEDNDGFSSSEEYNNKIDRRTSEKIAQYGGLAYREFLPENAPVAGWIHENIH